MPLPGWRGAVRVRLAETTSVSRAPIAVAKRGQGCLALLREECAALNWKGQCDIGRRMLAAPILYAYNQLVCRPQRSGYL